MSNRYDLADKLLFQLDDGERQVIVHGLEDATNNMVLLDDLVARKTAHQLGLKVKGTLGVLVEAKRRGFIPSFGSIAMAMREEGIRFSKRLIEEISKGLGE